MNKNQALAKINPCSKCEGKPSIHYEPGCSFSRCVWNHADCPSLAAAPDDELDVLVERINEKNGGAGPA